MNGTKTIGWLLLGFGMFATAAYAAGSLWYGVGDWLGWTVFGLLPSAAGTELNRRARSTRRQRMEKEVLQLSAELGGHLTAGEVAVHSRMTIEESEQCLERLRSKGLMRLKVASNGSYVYECVALLSPEEKQEAERV